MELICKGFYKIKYTTAEFVQCKLNKTKATARSTCWQTGKKISGSESISISVKRPTSSTPSTRMRRWKRFFLTPWEKSPARLSRCPRRKRLSSYRTILQMRPQQWRHQKRSKKEKVKRSRPGQSQKTHGNKRTEGKECQTLPGRNLSFIAKKRATFFPLKCSNRTKAL